ncbi:hypothetical protein CYLTODRAFT_446356 [Cylindrobasidium torrendii FP15055 ss-10]|uniref:Afadin and alpha-actinin-binding-domain-containing protein n=1 Tax=Cylindrobasidium torrendii FP15055 ss-10 TaxID=1314674 RepID=A0A0D7B2V0_9AGAR|nr:hypothetical protein CYLTODRAFT_446356 [Cylindrobasidium torrendii FP15055 ss-10]
MLWDGPISAPFALTTIFLLDSTMATPARKAVQWDQTSPGFSDLSSNASSEYTSASSLQYINAQLVAHGFVAAPGLSLEGVSNSEQDKTVKCLLDLLGQRMKDMNRTEELTGEVRTMLYDTERLRSMHASASRDAANFEREVNTQKSRLQAVVKNLQTSEQANKHVNTELARTRGLLQAVRTTHQTELKKRDKDIEKMTDKWLKLADSQAKLVAAGSGFKSSSRLRATDHAWTPDLSEAAIQEAETARAQLLTEYNALKHVILSAVNELQHVLHETKDPEAEPPIPFSMASLFPFTSPENAADNLASVLLDLRDSMQDLTAVAPEPANTFTEEERNKMQVVIDSLEAELEAAKAEVSHANASISDANKSTDAQAILTRFASDPRLLAKRDQAEVSVELMTVPQHDELHERLTAMRTQLEEERAKFTEATLELGRERAIIQDERKRLQEEKRAWQVQQMLSELPPTPPSVSVSPPAVVSKPIPLAPKSPRKAAPRSPKKTAGSPRRTSSGSRKATRVRRQSSLVASPLKSRVEPAYETEVVTKAHSGPPPMPPPLDSLPSFELPPPTPQPALRLPPPSPSALPTIEPQTPSSLLRPFPMAKPFAQRMVHAYSPARPSPLSRILSLGNSPSFGDETDSSAGHLDSPPLSGFGVLGALQEEEEEEDEGAIFMDSKPKQRQMTLEEELGIPESPPERVPSPLLEKPSNASRKGVVDKGKGRAPPPKGRPVTVTTKVKPSAAKSGAVMRGKETEKEKENSAGKKSASATMPKARVSIVPKPVMGKSSTSGPRRVPIASVAGRSRGGD